MKKMFKSNLIFLSNFIAQKSLKNRKTKNSKYNDKYNNDKDRGWTSEKGFDGLFFCGWWQDTGHQYRTGHKLPYSRESADKYFPISLRTCPKRNSCLIVTEPRKRVSTRARSPPSGRLQSISPKLRSSRHSRFPRRKSVHSWSWSSLTISPSPRTPRPRMRSDDDSYGPRI